MGNWVSWPLLKIFFLLKSNTVSRQNIPEACTIHHRKSQNSLIYLIIKVEIEKCFHTFTHCLGWQWGHQTAQKWRTVEDKNRSNTTRSNVSAVFYLGAAKAAKSFLFATYTCFIRRNRLSPARHRVYSSQGKNYHLSIFFRDTKPVWACPPSWHQLWPASLPSALLGWGSRAGPESCHQADPLWSSLRPGIGSQHGHEGAGRAARAGERLPARLGWGGTPAHAGERWGVSSRGLCQERRAGTPALLHTNKWGQLSPSKQTNRSTEEGKIAPFGFAAALHVHFNFTLKCYYSGCHGSVIDWIRVTEPISCSSLTSLY